MVLAGHLLFAVDQHLTSRNHWVRQMTNNYVPSTHS